MWLSGAALWGWYGVQSLLGLNPPLPSQIDGYAFFDRMVVAVAPLALVVALGIVWGWFLLRRLFGRWTAWVAALLWAIDPFYLANSKALHLDATLSTLMMLSALWMLIYLRERRWRQLVYSAILGGLAVLTKTSAIFLSLFLGLCLLVGWLLSFRESKSPVSNLKSSIGGLFLWVLVAAVVCSVLWPSLWVQPGKSLDLVVRQGILLHTDDPRDQPLLYRGTLAVHDPGPRFYLDVLLYRTTFLTLPFSLVGLLALWFRKREETLSLLLLVGFAVFFFVQMSLGSWKDGRYMLPVMLVVDVLAACGLVWCVEHVPVRPVVQVGIVGGLLLAQAGVVFFHHPYYGTYYNELLGGPGAALRVFPPAEWGEGLDLAGQYVDRQLGTKDAVVGTQFLAYEMVIQHVRAPVRDIGEVKDDVDYLVFGIQYTMRGKNYSRWGKLWEETYKFREPEFVASFGGIPYAWVYQPDSEPVTPQRVGARLGESIRLEGFRLAQDRAAPGDTLWVTLYWRADAPVDKDYTVFVHLQALDGTLVAQQDNPPVRGTRPTSGWESDGLIEDPYEIQIPADAAFGEYVLSAGMYDPATGERLAAFASGEWLPEDRVVLTRVPVEPVVPWWQWALSGVWLAIVAAGVVRAVADSRGSDPVERRGKPEGIAATLIAILAIFLYCYGAVVRLRQVNIDMTRGDQNAYLHYAVNMYEALYEGEEFRSRGAQGPLYPLLLSPVYDPSLTEEDYFVRGKYVSVGLSLIMLGCLFFIFREHFSLLHSANLILMTAFTVFLFKAPSFHAEPLFYFLSFCAFLLLCKMLINPSWKLGILTGFVIGLAHATKPSLLPALGLFLLFAVAKEVGPLCVKLIKRPRIASHPQFDVRAFSMRLVSIALVVIVFLGTVYPYIRSNKKVFGSYFYCVSTTFYMWYDSWEEAKLGTKAHGDRKGWPDMPPDQIPSLSKYLREHTAQQIVDRIVNGFKTLYQRSVESYGYYKYVLTYFVFLLAMVIFNMRHGVEMATKHLFLVLFCFSYFAAYLFAFAWYTPIASGDRFILALFLPFMFAASYAMCAQPTRYLPIRPFGFQIKLLDVLNILTAFLLSIDIYFIMTERLLTML
jgi:4-amino-4-deoxy-L-arabinose transferase-like glycosyltransferase